MVSVLSTASGTATAAPVELGTADETILLHVLLLLKMLMYVHRYLIPGKAQ